MRVSAAGFWRRLPGWVLLLCLAVLWTQAHAAPGATPGATAPVVLDVYVREGCPHCADAKRYLPTFLARRPWVQVRYFEVDKDPAARDQMLAVARMAGIWPPGVPMFVVEGRVVMGFGTPEESGPLLEDLVAGAQPAASPQVIDAGWLGQLSVTQLGLPLFTLAIGLLDGFNPCAMWVLLFLLSMLVHLHDRLRMALIAGVFVLVSGVVYYAFMAAWLNVFLAVGLSLAVRVGLALVALAVGIVNIKDFVTTMRGFSLSIPASAKPGLYARMRRIVQAESLWFALVAASVLAVVVNFIELLCTAGFPALYTAILVQQELSAPAYYGYLGLYIVGYMADDALMVATAVLALGSHKLTEQAGRWLKLLSGVVMLLLGVVMLLRPAWLQ